MNQEISVQLGRMNILRLIKRVNFGYYLDGGPLHGEILLPNGEVPDGVEFTGEQDVEVFIYLDQEERLIATMKKPLAQVGDFAYLEVAWVNNYGAFLHWGPMKDLFVPFREQKMKMQKGQKYIVHIHLDEQSQRIMASAKVEKWLSHDHSFLNYGDKVEALIWQKTDLGFKAIVNNQYQAVLYDSQIFCKLVTGDRVSAYINKVRLDGKIDLTLQRGQDSATDFSDTLLCYIREHGGVIHYGDKSPADEIYSEFGVSKKLFKKAIGDLYKKHQIKITPDGITLA